MKRLLVFCLLASAVALTATLPALANSDLIISEYVEGSSNNKAVEIWNHTGVAIDLAAGGYKIRVYANGSTSPTNTINLVGTIANNDAFVLAHSSSTPVLLALADQTSGSLQHNGNDAVELVKGASNTKVDVIGQIGFDPGTEWGTGLTSTADNTIRRMATVCAGDPIGSDVFDPSIQWVGYAVDTFGGLGTHTDDPACEPTGACCLSVYPTYNCQMMTAAQCQAAGGKYLGNFFPCSLDACLIVPTDARTWGSLKVLYR